MLLRPSSFMPFCTRVSSRCVPEGVAPSLDRGDEEGQGETQGSEETNLLAPVLECLRHHRIGQHGQERAAGEGLDEGDRFSAAAKRDRASTSPPRARTMRPRRSPDPWPHHPLERVWCSIRSGLLLRWLELHINRLRTPFWRSSQNVPSTTRVNSSWVAFLVTHHHNRAVGIPNYRVRNAAHQGSPHPPAPPAAHHYQTGP